MALAQHGIHLLLIIREIMCGVEEHLQHIWGMVQVDKLLYTAFQRPHESNDEWVKRFDAVVTVLEQYGRCMPKHPILLGSILAEQAVDKKNPTEEELVSANATVKEEYLSSSFC